MEGYGLAWILYALGAIGCAVAAWLLFRRLGREWANFFCVSVLALLLTPYAVDSETMVMAPAIFFIVFQGFGEGIESVMPIIMVVSGVWLVGLVVSLLVQLLMRRTARSSAATEYPVANNKRAPAKDDVDEDDYQPGDVPIRAER